MKDKSGFISKAVFWFISALFVCAIAGRVPLSGKDDSWKQINRMTLPETGLVQTPHNVVAFLNEHYGIMAGDWGESWFTLDGGNKWTRANEEVPGHRYGVEILNASISWSCGHRGDIGFTGNGGESWERISKYGGAERESCRYLSFIDDKTGWIASTTILGVTDDGGKSWRDLSLPPSVGVIAAIACIGKGTGYILDAEGEGVLYFTDDGGKSWSAKKIGLSYPCYPVLDIDTRSKVAMRFADKNHGIIVLNCVGQRVGAMYTEDGGKHFSQEILPVASGSLYISKDCGFLTICDFDNVVTVMKRLR